MINYEQLIAQARATERNQQVKRSNEAVKASKEETSVFTRMQNQLTDAAKEQAKNTLNSELAKTKQTVRKSKDKSFMTQAMLSDMNDTSSSNSASHAERSKSIIKHAEESARSKLNLDLAKKLADSNNKAVVGMAKQGILGNLISDGSSLIGGL